MKRIIHEILRKYWGYDEFRDLQEDIILSVLRGDDTLGLLPTGGGKSLTFQVPTLAMDGLALVVTPIISLMKDQVDNLIQRGIKATYLHAGLTMSEMKKGIDKCLYGNYKFLYVSPERLNSDGFLDKLRLMNISLIVVDEAHCISQWGYDFRPSYLGISKIRGLFPNIPMLALTASATKDVVVDILDKLSFGKHNVYAKSFSRPNLSYVVRHTEDKIRELIHILTQIPGSGIVYVRSRKKTKEISEILNFNNIPADYYHAGLSIEEKEDKQNKWKDNRCRIIVATNAFGMGIDKPNVRIVVHIDIPSSIEEYYQEAGRAGRDGNKSYVVLLSSQSDKTTLKRRLNDSFPPKDFIISMYESVGNFLGVALESGYGQMYDFDFNLFCKTYKYPITPTFNALKILTQSGYINFIEEVETQSRVMMLAKKEELYNLDSRDTDIDRVLQPLLRTYTGLFSDYVFISESVLSYRYNIPQDSIYKALLTLTKMHILHYVPRKRTPYIIYSTSRELPKYINISKEAYENRKERMEKRIFSMLNYAFDDDKCRETRILSYFGEENFHDCGKCDVCIARNNGFGNERKKEICDSINYMLGLKPRTLDDILQTLSFPKEQIFTILRELLSEDKIKRDENEMFHPCK